MGNGVQHLRMASCVNQIVGLQENKIKTSSTNKLSPSWCVISWLRCCSGPPELSILSLTQLCHLVDKPVDESKPPSSLSEESLFQSTARDILFLIASFPSTLTNQSHLLACDNSRCGGRVCFDVCECIVGGRLRPRHGLVIEHSVFLIQRQRVLLMQKWI